MTGEKTGAVLSAWVHGVRRAAAWIVIGFVLATAILARYAATNLGINSSTADMIASHLPWRQDFIDYRTSFPQFTNTLAVVIDAQTADLADSARDRLTDAMTADEKHFADVYPIGGGEFFSRNGFLFLDIPALEALTDDLARVQPVLGRLAADPGLVAFLAVLSDGMQAAPDGQSADLEAVLERVAATVRAHNENRFHQLSWREMMQGDAATDEQKRRLILAQPQLDFGRLQPAGDAIGAVRGLVGTLQLDAGHGVRVRLTGPVALEHEELASVVAGARLAGWLALAMVSVILFAALRSVRLIVTTLVTLAAGLIATAAFAAWAVGDLNLISIAFAVLYIGLGVDFAIHFCLRYREAIDSGSNHALALECSAAEVGASLVFCAVTTSVGFFAFFPTAFAGVSELGLICGTGMYISLFFSLTLLPALLTVMPLRPSAGPSTAVGDGPSAVRRILARPRSHPRLIVYGAVALAAGCAALLPRLAFDHNPLHLRDPAAESVTAYEDLLRDSASSPMTLSLLAEDADDARAVARRIAARDSVAMTVTVDSFVPDNQTEKLTLIDEMALILGSAADGPAANRTQAGREQAAAQFRQRLTAYSQRTGSPAANNLAREFARFDARHASPAAREEAFAALEERLTGTLPAQLDRLHTGLTAQPVTLADLPASLVRRWIAADGRHRVEVLPAGNLDENYEARRFIGEVREVAPAATGLPVVQLEAGRVVVDAFRQALATALILVSVLCLVVLRNVRDTLSVLAPIVLAGLATCAIGVVAALPFNFANIIALPLLLGIGVDNGIHMVHRARVALPAHGDILATSTARAVLFSTLTTVAGFGNLAFSPHAGMASMGRLLTIGMACTLLATLVLLPVLLDRREPK